jgi:hypothetical protein
MVPRCHTNALDDAVGDRRRGGLPAQARPVMMRRSCKLHAKLDDDQLTQRVSSRIRYAEMTRLLTTDPNAASAMQPRRHDQREAGTAALYASVVRVRGRHGREGRTEEKRLRSRTVSAGATSRGYAAAWLCFIGTGQPVSGEKASLSASVSYTRRHHFGAALSIAAGYLVFYARESLC